MAINILFSALSGSLIGLSFCCSSLSFLVWFSLIPFIYVVKKSRIKEGVVCAIIFALCYYGLALFWVTQVSKLGFIVLLFYLSLFYIVLFLCGRYFLHKPLRLISFSCLWVVVEFLKERVYTGFGWANLGYSQYDNFYLIQAADLWGAKFISFLIVLLNILIWEMICYFRQEKREAIIKTIISKVILVFLVFSGCFLYAFYRLNNLKDYDYLKVSIVQPNVPQELKWDSSAALSIINKLYILGKRAKRDTLTIFPESAWPFIVNSDNFDELQSLIAEIGKDTVIGVVSKEGPDFYNSALLFNKKAELVESYHKIKLVPFGEYVPLRKYLRFISIVNYIGDISKGEEFRKFSYKNKNFSVLICFEDVFPLHVVSGARNCDFLINITNDAWFGGEPEASQHLGIMTLRAIENRISIVRSANTGISGWTSLRGKINKLKRNGKDLFFADTAQFNISLNRKRSFYNRYPQILVGFCVIFLAGVFVVSHRRRGV